MLAPASVSVPAPILVSPPMPDMVQENVVLVLSLPVLGVAEPRVTLPPPASEPMVWLKPSRSSVAPLATVNALLAGMHSFAACSIPALIAVAPEMRRPTASAYRYRPWSVPRCRRSFRQGRDVAVHSTVPPAEFSLTSRLEKGPARYCSVPPLKLNPPRDCRGCHPPRPPACRR